MPDARKVYFIEGDGIGPEIWAAARPLIDAALKLESAAPIAWEELLAGEKARQHTGESLPLATLEKLRNAQYAIKGPLATPVGGGMRSLNVALRQTLDLYACIRPIQHIKGLETPVKYPERVNMVIFRENTEDVYAGIEFEANSSEARKLIAYMREELGVAALNPQAAVGIKPMSEQGSKRLIAKAMRYALDNQLPSVTLVHKGNIMKYTEGAFRKWGYELANTQFAGLTCSEADARPGKLVIKDRIADAMFQEALLHPDQYSVLATSNLNGDYLSDALAAQVGGLGMAAGVNMSDQLAFFEATHGTAPDIAGQDRANPGSLILCGVMLLDQLGEKGAAARLKNALARAVASKKVTADLGAQIPGSSIVGCREFAGIIGENL